MLKKCNKCETEKEIVNFHKKSSSKDGLKPYCKDCSSIIQKNYYINNKEIIKKNTNEYYNTNKEIILTNNKKYYSENKESISDKNKIYYIENIDKIKENSRKYTKENKDKINNYRRIHRKNNREYYKIYGTKYKKDRRDNDPLYKLSCTIRSLISISIKGNGYSKKSKTYNILGCSFYEFKEYLENIFQDGMNWDNQGLWHLDHKIPISWGKTEEEIYKLNHYTNFQPLWKYDNLSKGNRYASI
jgi:hypothetical protein